MQKIPMTVHGHQMLKDELRRLKSEERPKIVLEIEEARAHGDLSENAEYQYAKEKQGFIEGRIQEIEDKLARAEVIDTTKLSGDRIVFGATVTLLDLDTDKEVTYTIVGDDEADLKEHKVTVSSPIARALIGKRLDDEVQVQTPNGVREYEVLAITFKA